MVILFRNVLSSLFFWPQKGGCVEMEHSLRNVKVLVKLLHGRFFQLNFTAQWKYKISPQEQTFPACQGSQSFSV